MQYQCVMRSVTYPSTCKWQVVTVFTSITYRPVCEMVAVWWCCVVERFVKFAASVHDHEHKCELLQSSLQFQNFACLNYFPV